MSTDKVMVLLSSEFVNRREGDGNLVMNFGP